MSRRMSRPRRPFSFKGKRKNFFVNQKRSIRRKKAVALGWRIACDQDGAGVFQSDQYIGGSPSWEKEFGDAPDNSSFVDCYFMSRRYKREGYFYNTTIVSLVSETVEQIDSESFTYVENLLSAEQYKTAYGKMDFIKCSSGFTTIKQTSCPTFDEFGGKTIYGAKADFIRNALTTLDQRSFEISYSLDKDYCYGIGLTIVSNAKEFNMNNIVTLIETFIENGEEDFRQKVNIEPHLPALRAQLKMVVYAYEKRDAHDRNLPAPQMPLSEEERLLLENPSAALK